MKKLMKRRPIGVFDSGVGGLTVAKALINTLPYEDILYLGDTARVPYGIKSKGTVTRFSVECLKFLEKFNIKLAVVACNTASSWALKTLKRNFDFPVMGVIRSGVREAVEVTKNLKVGVIGTQATVESLSYVNEIKRENRKIKVYQKACPLFVPLVEENRINGGVVSMVAADYLSELRDKKIDTLILGCTHYPLLKDILKRVFHGKISIVDSSLSVSDEARKFLERKQIINDAKKKGKLRIFVTDDGGSFRDISRIFLGESINVRKVTL